MAGCVSLVPACTGYAAGGHDGCNVTLTHLYVYDDELMTQLKTIHLQRSG